MVWVNDRYFNFIESINDIQWLNECQTQMAQRAEEASTKWSFDFTRERPIDQPGPSPRIEYEAIPAEKVTISLGSCLLVTTVINYSLSHLEDADQLFVE